MPFTDWINNAGKKPSVSGSPVKTATQPEGRVTIPKGAAPGYVEGVAQAQGAQFTWNQDHGLAFLGSDSPQRRFKDLEAMKKSGVQFSPADEAAYEKLLYALGYKSAPSKTGANQPGLNGGAGSGLANVAIDSRSSGQVAGGGTVAPTPAVTNVQYEELPTYSGPTWDQSQVDSLTQKRAATGLAGLRQKVQTALSKIKSSNPQVQGMTSRKLFQGYGSGLADVMSSANTDATGEYTKRFALDTDKAKSEFESSVAKIKEANAWKKWKAENGLTA